MEKAKKFIWGALLIVLGVLLALSGLEIIKFSLFFTGWWAVLIMVLFGVGLITERDKVSCLIGFLIGLFLFLCCRGILKFSMIWKLIVPTVILIIGLKLVIGSIRGDKANKIIENIRTSGNRPKEAKAAFGAANFDYTGEKFEGAEFNSAFGALRCDLRGAIIEKDCAIRANAFFGGIEIFVPDNVNVKVYSNSIFGGVSNAKKSTGNGHTVFVNASVLFGGIDIK